MCKLTGHLIALLVVSSDCLDRYMLLQVVGQVDLIESCPSACVLKVLLQDNRVTQNSELYINIKKNHKLKHSFNFLMTYALLSFADLYHRTHFSIFQETTELSVSFILATQAGNDSQFPPKDLVDWNVGQDFFFTAYGIFLSSQDRCKSNFIFRFITKTDFSVRQCN